MRYLIAMLGLLTAVSATANPFEEAKLKLAGVSSKSISVGEPGKMNVFACQDSFAPIDWQVSQVYPHWATTKEIDYFLSTGLLQWGTDTPVAIRAVDVRYRPDGKAYDPYLGAVAKKASDFPGAIVWNAQKKYFAASPGQKFKPLCIYGNLDD